jgi:hypothetical protein
MIEASKSIIEYEPVEHTPDAWEMFEDRTQSILTRWHNYRARHPEGPDWLCVRGALIEIDDEYAKYLSSSTDPRD